MTMEQIEEAVERLVSMGVTARPLVLTLTADTAMSLGVVARQELIVRDVPLVVCIVDQLPWHGEAMVH